MDPLVEAEAEPLVVAILCVLVNSKVTRNNTGHSSKRKIRVSGWKVDFVEAKQ